MAPRDVRSDISVERADRVRPRCPSRAAMAGREGGKRVSARLSTLLVACMAVTGVSSSDAPVGVLDSESIFLGCGCEFSETAPDEPEQRAPLFSSDYEGQARVRVDGRVLDLTAVQPDTECLPHAARVGDSCVLKYRVEGTTVMVDVRATWVCPPTDEACEVVRLRGSMTISDAGRDLIFQVAGTCGC